MLWARPEKARRSDAPALANPVRLNQWRGSLDAASLLDLSNHSRTVSQALLGSAVTVREVRGEWARIAVAGQPTPLDARGYPGWVPLRQLAYSPSFEVRDDWPFVQIIRPKTPLYSDAGLRNEVNEAVYDTRLPYLEASGDAYRVALPDGTMLWIRRADAAYFRNSNALPRPTGESLLRIGRRFLEAPYIWGGITPYGVDCSGLIYTLFHAHGITLPRDTPQQHALGVSVPDRDLRPGDLLFFAKNGGRGTIHHVGLYAGNQKMLHAPNPRRTVRLATLHESGFWREYIGAKRIL